jgi:hypothetical protein
MTLKSGEEVIFERSPIFDKRCIEVYDYVIQNHVEITLRNGNWAQEFYRLDEALTYVNAQFSDKEFINQVINQTITANGQ